MPDFKALAIPLMKRGWRVTPVSADGKRGAARNWNKWQFRTLEDFKKFKVEKYATCNAGVVSFRGIGNLCFFDDDSGVAARIEKETRRKFPTTYQVRTRPGSDHMHYYFVQTEYSFKKFGWSQSKTINVRDISRLVDSPSGGKMHPTVFDLKGIGGASLVVASGSSRPNGDIYTCVKDVEPVSIPDWLVDWVVAADKAQEKALWRDRARKYTAKKNGADDFLIYEEDRTEFVKSYAARYVMTGLTGEALDVALLSVVSQFVENGESFVSTDRGLDSLARHARAAENWKAKEVGHAVHFHLLTEFYAPEGDYAQGLKLARRPLTDAEILREVIATFPDKISVEEARAALEAALPTFGRKHKSTLSRVRQELGFAVGPRHWERAPTPLTIPSSTYTGVGRDMSQRPKVSVGHGTLSDNPFENDADGGHGDDDTQIVSYSEGTKVDGGLLR